MPPPSFTAIDVETANSDPASICQIGVVHVRDGEIDDQWQTLINPQAPFRTDNVSIHGIDETTVLNSPTFAELYPELSPRLMDTMLVSHTSFDRLAFEAAQRRYGLTRLPLRWLDSAAIARRAWPGRTRTFGCSLASLAAFLQIEFQHHVALEDARAAALIVLRACDQTPIQLDDWSADR